MVELTIEPAPRFKKEFGKLDKVVKEKIEALIKKILQTPEIGKPMRYGRAGTRELYAGSHRFSYAHSKQENKIYLLDIYHKDEQ